MQNSELYIAVGIINLYPLFEVLFTDYVILDCHGTLCLAMTAYLFLAFHFEGEGGAEGDGRG
ncbi:MAG: hypothetical protein NC033_00185 [Clostridiales bacterium]|nr:hypothetical protein [Clostridiales bacterium]